MDISNKKIILEHLNKIVNSKFFKNSTKLCEFLLFIVKESLKKEGIELKQYNIAVHAFGRNSDFDPVDPIVRIQASRLRNNLNLYYQGEGVHDEIIISLPKGTYVPLFSTQSIKRKAIVAQKNTLAMLPFKNLSKDSKHQYVVDGFYEELLMEISRYKHIQIIKAINDVSNNDSLIARFSLSGSIRFTDNIIKISISVIDNHNHHLIWSIQKSFGINQIDWIDIQEEIAIKIGQEIADITGVLFETLIGSSNWKKNHSSEAYDAMLLFHHYNNNPNESDIELVVDRLEKIAKSEANIGLIWAVLANIYTDAYVFGEGKTYLDKALSYGNKATKLRPDNQICHTYYAYALCINGQEKLSIHHLNIALDLNPNSPYFMGSIGWCLCLNGVWKKGLGLVEKSMQIDFNYPKWFHIVTFLDLISKKNYIRAYNEAYKFDTLELFWDPLTKLIACYKLKKMEEAKFHLSGLLLLKPNFIAVCEELVGHLVKSESLKENMLNSIKEVFAYKPIKNS